MEMKIKGMMSVALASVAATVLFATPAIAGNANDDKFREFTVDYDPSSVAATNDHLSVRLPQKYLERWRIMTDLDNDGKSDMLLSETENELTNSGLGWFVYISSNNNWRCVGSVWIYPWAFALERVNECVHLWGYYHCSCRSGTLGYYIFKDGKLSGKEPSIFVECADDGNSIYSRIYKAIFGYQNNHPYVFEESHTSTNGVVEWRKLSDNHMPSRKDEIYALKQKIAEVEKRAAAADAKIRELSGALHECEYGTHRLCGIVLGEKWNGGETNRPCEEVISGFTNLTVKVDGNGFVEAVRLTRNMSMSDASRSLIRGGYEPTDEEQKIIHQVENLYRIRLMSGFNGTYTWGSPMRGTRIYVHFGSGGESENYIELKYSRKWEQ